MSNHGQNYAYDLSTDTEFFSSYFLEKLAELNQIIKSVGEPLEGNMFYSDRRAEHRSDYVGQLPEDRFLLKRRNISLIAPNIKVVVEVGVNGGHSALLWLMANPGLTYIGVDIGKHKYTKKAVDFLSSVFGERFSYLEGDSLEVLPAFLLRDDLKNKSIDLFHVDGGHGAATALADMINAFHLRNYLRSTYLLIDDASVIAIKAGIDAMAKNGYIKIDTLNGQWKGEMNVLAQFIR